MDELGTWLRAVWDDLERELDEDERVAREATRGPWTAKRADRSVYPQETSVVMGGGDGGWYIVPFQGEGGEGIEPDDAEHIARQDPAHTLARIERERADIAAKRRILEMHADSDFPYDPENGPGGYSWTPQCQGCYENAPCLTVRLLALPDAGHDGWREEWRPDVR